MTEKAWWEEPTFDHIRNRVKEGEKANPSLVALLDQEASAFRQICKDMEIDLNDFSQVRAMFSTVELASAIYHHLARREIEVDAWSLLQITLAVLIRFVPEEE